MPFTYADDVVEHIVSRCTEYESGGRMIDALLTNTVLPQISRQILTGLMEGQSVQRTHLSMADGQFAYAFE
jgi:type VI secretion system protein VasG